MHIRIGNGCGRLGVIFCEIERRLFIEERIHARGGAGRIEAGIHLHEFLLPGVEAELGPETRIVHRCIVHLLEGRHYRPDRNLQGEILARMDKARTENRAERPLPKEQTAPQHLVR